MPVFDNIPSNDVICAVTFSAATWAVVFFLVPDVDGHSLVVSWGSPSDGSGQESSDSCESISGAV